MLVSYVQFEYLILVLVLYFEFLCFDIDQIIPGFLVPSLEIAL